MAHMQLDKAHEQYRENDSMPALMNVVGRTKDLLAVTTELVKFRQLCEQAKQRSLSVRGGTKRRRRNGRKKNQTRRRS